MALTMEHVVGKVVAKRNYPDYYALDVAVSETTMEGFPPGQLTCAINKHEQPRWEPEVGDFTRLIVTGSKDVPNEALPLGNDTTLSIYTVYDHPADFPTQFVARRHVVYGALTYVTMEAYGSEDIEVLREAMRNEGRTCLPRDPGDDPSIIESWL